MTIERNDVLNDDDDDAVQEHCKGCDLNAEEEEAAAAQQAVEKIMSSRPAPLRVVTSAHEV